MLGDYWKFLIKFVKAQEGQSEDVVNTGAQTGDLFLWLICTLMLIFVISSVVFVLYRKYSYVFSGFHSSAHHTKQNNSRFVIIGAIICLAVVASLLTYLGTTKAEAVINDEITTVNAQVFDDGHIEVDDCYFINNTDTYLTAGESSIVLDDTVKEDEKLQASLLNVKALGGTIFDGKPDGERYQPLNADELIKPGENAPVDIQISNLDGQSALSYLDKQIYLISVLQNKNYSLSFKVSPDTAEPAKVEISQDGQWVDYINGSKIYRSSTRFVVDENEPNVLYALSLDETQKIDSFRLNSADPSKTYSWNPDGYYLIGNPLEYYFTQEYYTVNLSSSDSSIGNVYDEESGGDVVNKIEGDLGTTITIENGQAHDQYFEKSKIKFKKDGEEKTYYALPNTNDYIKGYFKEWSNIPVGQIWEDPENSITANFVAYIDLGVYGTVNNDFLNMFSDDGVWSMYYPTNSDLKVYCDNLQETAYDFLISNGFVEKYSTKFEDYYFVYKDPLTIKSSSGDIIEQNVSCAFAFMGSSSPELPSTDELKNMSMDYIWSEMNGLLANEAHCFTEEVVILPPCWDREDPDFIEWYKTYWCNHYSLKYENGTPINNKMLTLEIGDTVNVVEGQASTTDPSTPIKLVVSPLEGEEYSIYLWVDQDAFNNAQELFEANEANLYRGDQTATSESFNFSWDTQLNKADNAAEDDNFDNNDAEDINQAEDPIIRIFNIFHSFDFLGIFK